MSDQMAVPAAEDAATAREPLSERIGRSRGGHEVVREKLKTDQRVLARVTDGIYREPASALRELISNAYDADATEVVIQTDRPRFSTITVADNGNGMSPAVVAHVVEHIGGSAKRSSEGSSLGVTQPGNRFLSPKGRRLIGRIGIGLFSVSQLTQAFQIITKVKGDPWRTIAMVNLRTYDDVASTADDEDYEAGEVSIWRVPAQDIEMSGTTVILTEIRRHTIRILSDADRWVRVENGEPPPRYHVGHVENSDFVKYPAQSDIDSLPWDDNAEGVAAFSAMVDVVWDELVSGTVRNPSLDLLFDKYLQTVWQIALAAPLPYVGTHPLLVSDIDADRFELPKDKRQPAIQLSGGESLAARLGVDNNIGEGSQPFHIFIDNLELRRPLRFAGLPATSHALKKPLLFAEHVREKFENLDPARSGGPLEFTGYIMWAPKIAPIEHNGALIRVHGASGTLFDPSFLHYGVAELTRLRQLSCEIFVTEGFEAALNIDREGFNQSHPHARRITSWLHAAIGRAINTQKTLANQERKRVRAETATQTRTGLQQLAARTWRSQRAEAGGPPPVRWDSPRSAPTDRLVDEIVLKPDIVLGQDRRESPVRTREQQQAEAIAQILAAFDLLEHLSSDEINQLIHAVISALRLES